MGAGATRDADRTARALFRAPLTGTAAALTSGQISAAHARVLANGTRDLPDHIAMEAEPVLLEAAARLDPPLLRQAVGYLLEVADPGGADAAHQRRHGRRGLWPAPTLDHMVAVTGLLDPEAGTTLQAALEPLARPADAHDPRNADQRNADALTELARRSLEGAWLPKAGGVRPQQLVTVDLDSLLGRPGGLGGDMGWVGPLDREACRRLACDGAVTRVLVTGHPTSDQDQRSSSPGHLPTGQGPAADHDPGADHEPGELPGLQGRLQAAMALLPPTWAAPGPSPWTWGGPPRVVQPAQRGRPGRPRPWLCLPGL